MTTHTMARQGTAGTCAGRRAARRARRAAHPSGPRGPLPTGLLALALPLAFVLLWSSGFIGAELGARVTTPDTLLIWRFVFASALLLLVCAATGRRITSATLRRHVPLGVLMQFVYLAGVFHGVEAGVSGSTVALVAALQPVLVAVVGILALRESLSWRAAVGLALGFGGVALVVSDGLGAGSAPGWAYLLPIGGMLALALGTILAQRVPDRGDLLAGLTVQTVTAAVGFTVWALLAGTAAPSPTRTFAGAVAWVVVLAGFGGYGTYLLLLATRGAATVSALLYLTPPTTALWSAMMFGTPIRAAALLGMAVSTLGVLVFLRARRRSVAGSRAAGSRDTGGRVDGDPIA